MSEVHINHAFISTKAESADNTIVSKNEWNEDLVLSGGTNGQQAIADDTQDSGAKWVQGPTGSRVADTFSGGATSGELSSTILTTTERSYVFLFVEAGAITASGNDAVISLRRNGSTIKQWEVEGVSGNIYQVGTWVIAETAGTHTYSLIISIGGSTITSSNVALSALIVGRY